MALWSWVNVTTARYGEEHLGDRYLRIRFEDLCSRPAEVARGIVEFFGLTGDRTAIRTIAPPASLGRWRGEALATIEALEEQGGAALVELGYAQAAP